MSLHIIELKFTFLLAIVGLSFSVQAIAQSRIDSGSVGLIAYDNGAIDSQFAFDAKMLWCGGDQDSSLAWCGGLDVASTLIGEEEIGSTSFNQMSGRLAAEGQVRYMFNDYIGVAGRLGVGGFGQLKSDSLGVSDGLYLGPTLYTGSDILLNFSDGLGMSLGADYGFVTNKESLPSRYVTYQLGFNFMR